MSMYIVALAYASWDMLNRDKILSGGATTVDYEAVVDVAIEKAKARGYDVPEPKPVYIRALMNAFTVRLTLEMISIYRKGVSPDDQCRFKSPEDQAKFNKAWSHYLDFILDPVYTDVAPEIAINSLVLANDIPRRLRSAADARSDLMISRLNEGAVYATPKKA